MKFEHLEIKNFNFIGINSQTSGNVCYYGKTYYFGSHEGNIHQIDDCEINIQHEADIKGDLNAINANIYGKIHGNLEISGTLNIFSGGSVEGVIRAKNLNIHPGANVSGEIHSIN